MGSSITTFSKATDSGGAVLEPLVEDEQIRDERARIAEAFHYSRKDQEDSSSIENNPTTHNPAEDGRLIVVDEKKLQSEQEQFDPFRSLKQVDGWSTFVHVITPDDTLAGLSLRYNVSTDDIRRANFMTDDRLTSFVKIIIPKQSADSPSKKTAIEVANTEDVDRLRKQKLINLLHQMDEDKLSPAAALYYLDRNSYNLKHAMTELEADAEWEKDHRMKSEQ